MPEITFTLTARYETHPREGGFASAKTHRECLNLDKNMLEEGVISLAQFLDFIGDFAEFEWRFDLDERPTYSEMYEALASFQTQRGH